MLIFKARPRKSPNLSQTRTPSEERIMRMMAGAMDKVRADVVRDEKRILDALMHDPVERVVNLVSPDPWLEVQADLEAELLGELIDAGKRIKLPSIQKATITYRFDGDRPEARAWAAKESGNLIREIVEDQRTTVRDYVERASAGDANVTQVARGLRDVVGLTTAQSGWVENFRNREILDQMNRGKTYDQAYSASEAATERYQKRIHKYRTETIARTEIIRASSEGRVEAWRQGIEEGFISRFAQKQWVAEFDACQICLDLEALGPIGVTSDFPEGEPPAHPNCRCDVILIDDPEAEFEGVTDDQLDQMIDTLLEPDPNRGMGRGARVNEEEFDEMSRFSGKEHIIGRDENGIPIFTEERAALHDKIVDDVLKGYIPSDDPTYTMLGGGPASGKTTALGKIAGASDPLVATVDPDAIKGMLPEYRAMVAAKDEKAAAFVHEESSYLAKRVQQAAFERRVPVLLDGTGDGSNEGLLAKIEAAKASGYRVRGFYATITVDEAIQRSTLRAERTGRKVPEEKIRFTHAKVSAVFPTAAANMDEIELYDTTERTPRLIARGEGGTLTVRDEDTYEGFLRKADVL